MTVRPILDGYLEFITAGRPDRHLRRKDPIACPGVAVGSIVVHGIVQAPPVKATPHVPVRQRGHWKEGKRGQGGHIGAPVGVCVGHVGVAGHGVLGMTSAAGREDLQGDGGGRAQRCLGHAILDPVVPGPVSLLTALGDQAVIAPARTIPVIQLDILQGVPVLVVYVQSVLGQVSRHGIHGAAPRIRGCARAIHPIGIEVDAIGHAPTGGRGIESNVVVIRVLNHVQVLQVQVGLTHVAGWVGG